MLSKHANLIRLGLEGCYLSGAHRFAGPWRGGLGAILALRHVKPRSFEPFQPNRTHEITPEFLEQAILRLRESGFDIVSLDEAMRRLKEPGKHNKFVALTFDGAWRDILIHAYPVLKKHNCPFTVYVATAFPDGEGLLWQHALEHVIGERDVVTVHVDGEPHIYLSNELDEKYEAYADISWHLHTLGEKKLRAFMADFCGTFRFDMKAACRETCMNWFDIAQLAADPLVTIGAQALDGANLPQIRESARILEAALDWRPKHFSCSSAAPNAAREFGFTSTVTRREGVLYEENGGNLHALPRVPLSGDYQALRYLDVLLSGLPFYVLNGFERFKSA